MKKSIPAMKDSNKDFFDVNFNPSKPEENVIGLNIEKNLKNKQNSDDNENQPEESFKRDKNAQLFSSFQ